MQKINLIYDDILDDVDILLVPDCIAYDIENVIQEFGYWLSVPENSDQFLNATINGHRYLAIGTAEFMWWLNNIKITGENKAVITDQHTTYNPGFPVANL